MMELRKLPEVVFLIERKSTKELILSSLYDLLRDKPYEKITVSAIVKNCGISQRTFYHHFRERQRGVCR